MDWYYPVLTGALTGEQAKARLADGWAVFAMEGKGIRCVSDEPWITASETAEAAIAHAAIGDVSTATDLLALDPARTAATTARTGPASCTPTLEFASRSSETTAYTGAAVILAADAITGASPASTCFVPAHDSHRRAAAHELHSARRRVQPSPVEARRRSDIGRKRRGSTNAWAEYQSDDRAPH